MKKFKFSFLAILAIFAGFGMSAFTVHHAPKAFSDEWFTYNGSGSMTDPTNYTYQETEPPCVGSDVLCSIKVLNDGGQPDQDALTALYDNNDNFSQPVTNKIVFRAQ